MMDVFNQIDLRADVARLKLPVAVLVGESGRSGATKPGMKQAIATFQSLCPHAVLLTIPNAGSTFSVVEQPEATAIAITSFLRGL
jgi:pimeloyl-ACP methyl ester carboxylesterase